jgi:hypothetical protein
MTMHDIAFDRITQRLGTDASRRHLLGGLVGVTAALLAGSSAVPAKPKDKPGKTQLCHGSNLLSVSRNARRAHRRHGDRICRPRDCQVVTGCTARGACVFEADPAAEGQVCQIDGDLVGRCNAEGECIPSDGDGGTTGS